ncbi:MBL fold metallo-hydrolase [Pyrobaculum neutrophilum]|uniref:Ribonuclease Z n=1 Tax=Pyrobaculum neutrophilum (strain DSM 2338 / JCM 9278 / NBRC 100436 / V24Sta) TaxID=444157 RepID=RNZ_PYRNV|nr:MBL fold metallo-hydrolase [Pyrobaculum neutrophilum]B1YAJ2.1 RecName: Full=Ribonuclease Z; Short=RNase Z; AltName: Full=tRNA 3 endonuclease; AltName: Full=tRNase Z [Pyrobaculum neutrophilum V24Sta]ACB40641.1 Ribonuclease Z [Pyrobaculum neutrophilum V24Sta]
MPLLKLVFLGTGGAVPRSDRTLPAIYLEDWLGHRFLLDAGEGAQYRLLQIGVSPASLTAVAITHQHEDHTLGLPGLVITSRFLGGRTAVLAPRSMHKALEALGVEVMDSYGGDRLRVSCVEVCHTVDACGWLFQWDVGYKLDLSKAAGLPRWALTSLIRGSPVEVGGRLIKPEDVAEPGHKRLRRLLYTGDTAPCPEMWRKVGEVDVLIHEATFADDVEPQKAHEEGHSTVADAVEAAKALNAGVLILTHVSSRYPDKRRHRELAASVKPPPHVYVPEDFDTVLVRL